MNAQMHASTLTYLVVAASGWLCRLVLLLLLLLPPISAKYRSLP
jgi:hypothetical protein